MWLTRTILQQNTDPSFIDSLLGKNIIGNRSELFLLLEQWKKEWFSKPLLDYMFLDYEDDLKNIIKNSFHPVMIKSLQQYTLQQGVQQRNIANHSFSTPDVLCDFFAPYKTLGIEKNNMDKLIKISFTEKTMLLGASFVFTNRDAMYFIFSTIEKQEPDEEGFITVKFIDQKIMSSEWNWLTNISWYLQENFPEHNLFELLNLNPDTML